MTLDGIFILSCPFFSGLGRTGRHTATMPSALLLPSRAQQSNGIYVRAQVQNSAFRYAENLPFICISKVISFDSPTRPREVTKYACMSAKGNKGTCHFIFFVFFFFSSVFVSLFFAPNYCTSIISPQRGSVPAFPLNYPRPSSPFFFEALQNS